MARVSVVRVKNDNVEAAVREAIEMAGDFDIGSGEKILIKPNLCCDKPSGSGVVTNMSVVAAVVKVVREMGAKPLVGDIPIVGFDPQHVYDALGVKEIVEKAGGEFIDLSKEERIVIQIPNARKLRRVKIVKTTFEVDGIISVPVLKTHFFTGVTLSIKNLKGLTDQDQRTRIHVLGLNTPIVDLLQVLRNQIRYVIIDGTYVARQIKPSGPYYGPTEPKDITKLDLIIAGRDPVAVDAVGAQIMGFNPKDIAMLREAAERGLGEIENIEIVGEMPGAVGKFETTLLGKIMRFLNKFWTSRIFNPLVHPLAKKLFGPEIVAYRQVMKEMETGKKGEVVLTGECDGCGICVRSCKVGNIKLVNNKPVIGDKCIKCFICVEACPKGALSIVGL
ncbi:MAG: DUF362 domain-containing protein [Candidatus Baldrarchaeia archaeon]